MRHGRKFNHLSRPASHRRALLMNQAKSLILHKRIITTVAKAKALKKFVEPIITRAKQDSMHSRRVVFSYFQDKEPVKLLFNEVAPKIGDRPGGYTRIIRMGNRPGDNSEMCLIELVDYNTYLQKEGDSKLGKAKTRRGKGKPKDKSEVDSQSLATEGAQSSPNKQEEGNNTSEDFSNTPEVSTSEEPANQEEGE